MTALGDAAEEMPGARSWRHAPPEPEWRDPSPSKAGFLEFGRRTDRGLSVVSPWQVRRSPLRSPRSYITRTGEKRGPNPARAAA